MPRLWMNRVGVILVLGTVGMLVIPHAQSELTQGVNQGAAHRYLLTDPLFEARESYYSNRVSKLLKHWPPVELSEANRKTASLSNLNSSSIFNPESNPDLIKGIRISERPTYVGVLKQLKIHAPMENVAAVIENFEGYPSFFKDVKRAQISRADGNKLTVSYERFSPVIFLSNITYDMIYLIEKSENRISYRYQIVNGTSIQYSDGIVVLERQGEFTRLVGYDFYDVNWGILGGIAAGRIWRESLEGSYKGDIALKSRIEHPEWSLNQILQNSDAMLARFPIEPIQYMDHYDWDKL